MAPGVQQRGPRQPDQLRIAGDDPQVEQPDAGAELAAGDLGALGRGPDRVVQLDPAVPQRIPDPVGEGVDRLLVLAVVQQDQVDVGAGAELAAGETADAGERDLGPRALDRAVQLDQGVLDAGGERTPTIRP
jgi:hypothetical protein